MRGDVRYAQEKYSVARDTLAEGTGNARERLLDAYSSSACRLDPLRPGLGAPISDELATRIDEFNELMTSAEDHSGQGTIAATIDAMTDDEVAAAMREMIEISHELDFEYHSN